MEEGGIFTYITFHHWQWILKPGKDRKISAEVTDYSVHETMGKDDHSQADIDSMTDNEDYSKIESAKLC